MSTTSAGLPACSFEHGEDVALDARAHRLLAVPHELDAERPPCVIRSLGHAHAQHSNEPGRRARVHEIGRGRERAEREHRDRSGRDAYHRLRDGDSARESVGVASTPRGDENDALARRQTELGPGFRAWPGVARLAHGDGRHAQRENGQRCTERDGQGIVGEDGELEIVGDEQHTERASLPMRGVGRGGHDTS